MYMHGKNLTEIEILRFLAQNGLMDFDVNYIMGMLAIDTQITTWENTALVLATIKANLPLILELFASNKFTANIPANPKLALSMAKLSRTSPSDLTALFKKTKLTLKVPTDRHAAINHPNYISWYYIGLLIAIENNEKGAFDSISNRLNSDEMSQHDNLALRWALEKNKKYFIEKLMEYKSVKNTATTEQFERYQSLSDTLHTMDTSKNHTKEEPKKNAPKSKIDNNSNNNDDSNNNSAPSKKAVKKVKKIAKKEIIPIDSDSSESEVELKREIPKRITRSSSKKEKPTSSSSSSSDKSEKQEKTTNPKPLIFSKGESKRKRSNEDDKIAKKKIKKYESSESDSSSSDSETDSKKSKSSFGCRLM